MSKDTERLYMIVRTEVGDFMAGSRFAHVTVAFTSLRDAKPYGLDSHGDNRALCDLVVNAQFSTTDSLEGPYGWRVEYRSVYTADLREVERMVKALRKVERGLERIRDNEGDAESFGQYVNRVARVLKVAGLIVRLDGDSMQFSDNEWRVRNGIGHIASAINDIARKLDKDLNPDAIAV